MSHATNEKHASPSGLELPENFHIPRKEGQHPTTDDILPEPWAVHSAREILAGRLPVTRKIGLAFEEITCSTHTWAHNLLSPDSPTETAFGPIELVNFVVSDQESKASDTIEGGWESDCATGQELDQDTLDGALSIYNRAIEECVAALYEASSGFGLLNNRIHARLCIAFREELKTLLAEMDAISRPKQQRVRSLAR